MYKPLSRASAERDPTVTTPNRITAIPTAALATGNFALELQGKDHGDPGISLILVEAAPGRGPSLHQHDYAEVIVVQEGIGTFSDGVTSRDVTAGNVVIIPAGQPHAFRNTGDGPLKQIDIHVADTFGTDWLCQTPPCGA